MIMNFKLAKINISYLKNHYSSYHINQFDSEKNMIIQKLNVNLQIAIDFSHYWR